MPSSSFTVNVHGVSLPVRMTPTNKKTCHFVGVNVLGMDFLWQTGASVVPDIPNSRFALVKGLTMVSESKCAESPFVAHDGE